MTTKNISTCSFSAWHTLSCRSHSLLSRSALVSGQVAAVQDLFKLPACSPHMQDLQGLDQLAALLKGCNAQSHFFTGTEPTSNPSYCGVGPASSTARGMQRPIPLFHRHWAYLQPILLCRCCHTSPFETLSPGTPRAPASCRSPTL